MIRLKFSKNENVSDEKVQAIQDRVYFLPPKIVYLL